MLMNFLYAIGNVAPPPQFGPGGYAADIQSGGLLQLVSNIVKLIIIVGGLWAFFNLLIAGITYITSGDKPDEIQKATQRINLSLIGLLVLVGSFVLAGIFGYLLYGDASAILNPKIYGPGN